MVLNGGIREAARATEPVDYAFAVWPLANEPACQRNFQNHGDMFLWVSLSKVQWVRTNTHKHRHTDTCGGKTIKKSHTHTDTCGGNTTPHTCDRKTMVYSCVSLRAQVTKAPFLKARVPFLEVGDSHVPTTCNKTWACDGTLVGGCTAKVKI